MGLEVHLPGLIFSILFTVLWVNFHQVRSSSVDRSAYIVHMDKSLMPKAFATHNHWYASTVDSTNPAGPTASDGSRSSSIPSLIYTYDNAMHGFSALLSEDELEAVKSSVGFVSAYRDHTEAKLRTTHTPEFLCLSPSAGIWPASEFGKDVIVGLADSGVWPESLSFRDDGMTPIPARWKGTCEVGQEFNASMCNSKLIGARYFNKGLLASKRGVNISMNSARDTNGHGTHTASTAAGNYAGGASFFGYAEGTARGIAPRARVAIYKVFSAEGFASSDFLAGIDQAVADGIDILSLSIGFDYDLPLYENPIAISCFGAMEKGVFVTFAAGNTGILYDAIPWTLTVAAGTIDRTFAGKLTLGNGLTITGWTLFPSSALVENLPLIYNKTTSSNCEGSFGLIPQAPYGILICENVSDVDVLLSLLSTVPNVAAAILISDDPGLSTSSVFPWPGVVISPKEGHAVIKYAKNDDRAWASMKFKQTIIGTKPAPAVAYYSSRGPSRTYTGILKPDLMAPGSQVLAAWVPNKPSSQIGLGILLSSNYDIVSGTSMASPHAAGVAALLKAAHPEWSPAAIRSAMMTTANPLDNTNNPIRDQLQNHTFASPLAMGSGQVDPNQALDPGLVYDTTPQDYVNVLCYMNYTHKQILAITRSNGYNCSNPSPDLNYPSFIALYTNKSTATLSRTFQRTLTNVGDGGATYNAKVIAPAGSKVTVSPKVLVFGHKHEKKSYKLSIKYERGKNELVTYGSLIWVEDNGKHSVRSPIVVSPDVTR